MTPNEKITAVEEFLAWMESRPMPPASLHEALTYWSEVLANVDNAARLLAISELIWRGDLSHEERIKAIGEVVA